jgi:hypothetical protein
MRSKILKHCWTFEGCRQKEQENMETETPQENENEDTSHADSQWDNRILCSDGNCIGVIGPDGRCKECGKLYEDPRPETTVAGEEQGPVEDVEEETPAEAVEKNTVEESPADDEWENRRLCRDGNCIGVIGPDGKCKECGKPYE